MPIKKLTINGYRSVQDLFIRPQNINVILGPNGSGKTNIYKAIQLLSKAAVGELARTIAKEGGMPSILWAGSKGGDSKLSVCIQLDQLKYELECGIEPKPYIDSYFGLDPEVKR